SISVVRQHEVDTLIQIRPALHYPFGKADADHRITHRPVPPLMAKELAKQRLIARKQLGQRVDEQALAKAARARQEVMRPALDQTQRVARLVDVVVVLLPNLGKGLDADRQLLAGHGGHPAAASGDGPIIRRHMWRHARSRAPLTPAAPDTAT